MPSFEGDTPSRPFGGAEEYGWSPDGSEISFTTQLGLDSAWSTDLNVFIVGITAGKVTTPPKCISCANIATDTAPAYSPDGKFIAYLAMSIPAYESDLKHIRVFDRSTGSTKTIAGEFDRGVESVTWSADSKTIYGIAWDSAYQRMFQFDVATGSHAVALTNNFVDGVSPVTCPDNPQASKTCFIYTQADFAHPAELYVTLSTGASAQLSKVNENLLKGIEFQEWTEFWTTGAKNEQIHSWVLKPYGYVAGQKYPLAVIIHGGPEDPWFNQFHYRWNAEIYTGAGYAVIMTNYHGSASFGSNFTRSILGDWGGAPYFDIMAAVDAAAVAFPWIDTSKMGALGASYGGYMINYINTQTTRFKCLVCHDGVWDTQGQFYYTDELYFPTKENGDVPPYVDPTLYQKFSPMLLAERSATPQLTIHGGRDYRIPDVSGISAFTSLQRKGIPSQLILFPEENHWVMNPKNSVYWHTEVLAWLARFLKA
jgi:dipeptidyl aminopeptidase/acylaminoacyl peptidase